MLSKLELLLRYIPHNYRAHNKEIQKEKKLKFEMEWINGRGEKTDIQQVFDSLRIINNDVAKSFSRIDYLTIGKAIPTSRLCINKLNLIQKHLPKFPRSTRTLI
jgi:hypothetical protein